MKYILLPSHVVEETLNLVISRSSGSVVNACRTCNAIMFPLLNDNIILLWHFLSVL